MLSGCSGKDHTVFLLSGYKEECLNSFRQLFPEDKPDTFLTRSGIEGGGGIRSLYTYFRREKSEKLFLYVHDVKAQNSLLFFKILLLLSSARQAFLFDSKGRIWKASGVSFFFKDFPFFFAEVLCGILSFTAFQLFLLFLFLVKAIRGEDAEEREQVELGIFSVQRKVRKKRDIRKVLYIRTLSDLGVKTGGSVTHTSGVINGFLANGCDLQLVSNDILAGVSEKVVQKEEDCVHLSPFFRLLKSITDISYNFPFLAALFKRLRIGRKPDASYQRYTAFNVSGVCLRLLFRIPLLLEYNGSEYWVAKNWGGSQFLSTLKRVEQLNLEVADVIVVVSQVLKDQLVEEGVTPEKILVNPNGVDVDAFAKDFSREEKEGLRKELHIPAEHIVFGFLGTFGQWHGIPVLKELIPLVCKRWENVSFLLIGDGLLKQMIEDMVVEEGLQERVILTGSVSHEKVPLMLCSCNALLSPHVPNRDGSKFIGSPTKLFEYMATGVPVIASSLEQIGDILEDKKTALLVKPGDVDDLFEAVKQVMKNPGEVSSIGVRAQRLAIEKYSWKSHVAVVLSFFSFMPEKS